MAGVLLPPVAWDHAWRMAAEPTDAAPSDEAAILSRFVAGDDQAFSTLVQRYQQIAFTVASRITLRDDLALDVVQEAFLRCLRHRLRFDASKAFKPWLLQIVRHLAIDVLRVQRRIDAGTSAGMALERAATTADPALPGEQREVRARVASVLAGMPEKYRDLLIMRELEELPAEQIARQLGLDYGTTRWRLHEARRLFRVAWLKRFGTEEAHG
jgi:RNA polymerase sigma-70 factor (ECF subfamily)